MRHDFSNKQLMRTINIEEISSGLKNLIKLPKPLRIICLEKVVKETFCVYN